MTPGLPSSETTARRLVDALETVVQGMMRVARLEASVAGLSMPQFFILRRIHRRGSIPSTEWAGQTGTRASSASGLVEGLVRNGWVIRSPDPDDRRKILIRLSLRGTRLVERVDARRRARVRATLRGLAPSELEQTTRVAEGLARRFSVDREPTRRPGRTRTPARRVPPRRAPATQRRTRPREAGSD